MEDIEVYDASVGRKVEGMINVDQLPDCPPTLPDPVKLAKSEGRFATNAYLSKVINFGASESPPYHVFHKLDLHESLSEQEKIEQSKFKSVFTILSRYGDICDRVGLMYLAKSLAYAENIADMRSRDYILNSLPPGYEDGKMADILAKMVRK